MKRLIRIVRHGLLAFALLLPGTAQANAALPEPTDLFYVNDFANVIDASTENLIAQNGSALDALNGTQVVLVTVDFVGSRTLSDYAADLLNKWELGDADKDNGVLILLSIGDDDYWTVQGSGLESTLTSGTISNILYDYLEADFAVQNYDAGASKVYAAFVRQLGGVWSEGGLPGEVGNGSAGSTDGAGADAGNAGGGNAVANPSPVPGADDEDSDAGFAIFIIVMILLLYFIFKRRRGGGSGRRGGRGYRGANGPYSSPYGRPPAAPPVRPPARRPPPPSGGGWFGGGSSSGGSSGSGSRGGGTNGGGGLFRGGGGTTRGGGAGRSSGGGLFGGGSSSGGSSGGGSRGGGTIGGGGLFRGGGGTTRGGGAGRRK